MKVYGDVQVLGKKTILNINSSPNENMPFSGFYAIDVVGQNVTYGMALYYNLSDEKWYAAKADDYNTMPCKAIALDNKSADEPCILLKYGTVYCDTWNFLNPRIYVSATNAGQLTHLQPNNNGHIIQIIGEARSNRIGLFDFCQATLECT